MSRFTLIKKFTDRHRFYTDAETGRIAIADQSVLDNAERTDRGPHTAADGLMFLDFSRPMRKGHSVYGTIWDVPLVTPHGLRSWTVTASPESDWLLDTFRFRRDGS